MPRGTTNRSPFEEEVVSLWMAVPDELARDLHYLDLVVVHRRDDARREALLEECELLRETDRLVHETPGLPGLMFTRVAEPRPENVDSLFLLTSSQHRVWSV